jgi:metal-responsive CopG/Arc/MetJ family transcriptional regulator
MATELITFKMDDKLLKEVDRTVKESGFHNRTEFIRNALREKVDEAKMKEAMKKFSYIKGSIKKNITEEQYERAREKAFHDLNKSSGEEVFRRIGL